jgi:hypothetical protein
VAALYKKEMLYHVTNFQLALEIILSGQFSDIDTLGRDTTGTFFPGVYFSYGKPAEAMTGIMLDDPETVPSSDTVTFVLTNKLLNAENYHASSSSNNGNINCLTVFPWLFRATADEIAAKSNDFPEIVFHDPIRTSNIVAIVAENGAVRRELREASKNAFPVVDSFGEIINCPEPNAPEISTKPSFLYYKTALENDDGDIYEVLDTTMGKTPEDSGELYNERVFSAIFEARHGRKFTSDFMYENEFY